MQYTNITVCAGVMVWTWNIRFTMSCFPCLFSSIRHNLETVGPLGGGVWWQKRLLDLGIWRLYQPLPSLSCLSGGPGLVVEPSGATTNSCCPRPSRPQWQALYTRWPEDLWNPEPEWIPPPPAQLLLTDILSWKIRKVTNSAHSLLASDPNQRTLASPLTVGGHNHSHLQTADLSHWEKWQRLFSLGVFLKPWDFLEKESLQGL